MPDCTMSEYTSNSTLAALATRIARARKVALVTHRKPDGDALGSVLALARVLRRRGRTADVLLSGPLEPGMAELVGDTPIIQVDEQPPGDDHDLIVVVDTGAWGQLEPLGNWLRRHHDKVIGIDHHAHGDDVASQRVVDKSAASTTQVLLPLLEEMGVEPTGEPCGVAEALFLGLATDTGWFRFSNADARAFAAASRLLATGVSKERVYQLIEESHRPARLALVARALASVRYERDAAVAMMMLGPADFRETHGALEDLTSVVNYPMGVASVRVSILLTQIGPGQTKISLRSKPSRCETETEALRDILDVNVLAQRFGGGGHVHAAGARVEMELADAVDAVAEAVRLEA